MLAGCAGKGPQRPSVHKGEWASRESSAEREETRVENQELALMEMNERLAHAADEELLHWVRAQKEPYALYECGTWGYILDTGDTHRPAFQPEEECTLHMRVYSLSGHLYRDIEQTAHVGKYELPTAIDENITEWHHGAHVMLLAPWYSAYGIQGKGGIPPYENVVIDLELK